MDWDKIEEREGETQPERDFRESRQLAALFPSISSQLRSGLSSLYLAMLQLAPPEAREQNPELDARAALLEQSYYRLLRLANNLSAAAHLTDDAPLPLQDVHLPLLIEKICGKVQGIAPYLQVDLLVQCDFPHRICGVNPQGIEQFLYQTLSNAFKFTPAGGTVTVTLAAERKTVLLSVADTGPGIDPDKVEVLHQLYLQRNRLDPPPHGLGLGLALCWRIAEGHGGRLLVTSQPGQGSKFTLAFPERHGSSGVSDAPFDYTGGFNPTLLALADALPKEAFLIQNR